MWGRYNSWAGLCQVRCIVSLKHLFVYVLACLSREQNRGCSAWTLLRLGSISIMQVSPIRTVVQAWFRRHQRTVVFTELGIHVALTSGYNAEYVLLIFTTCSSPGVSYQGQMHCRLSMLNACPFRAWLVCKWAFPSRPRPAKCRQRGRSRKELRRANQACRFSPHPRPRPVPSTAARISRGSCEMRRLFSLGRMIMLSYVLQRLCCAHLWGVKGVGWGLGVVFLVSWLTLCQS